MASSEPSKFDSSSCDEPETHLLRSTAPEHSLESAAAFVAAGAAAICAAAPTRSRYSAEFEALVAYAQENQLVLPSEAVPERADLAGQEHVIWIARDRRRVFKATYPNKFGFTVGRDSQATPLEYLRRLILTNEVFGDDFRFEGVCEVGGKIQVVVSQPFIVGELTKPEEIESFMTLLGFVGAEMDGQVCWFRQEDGLLAFDAHTRNFLTTPSGPIPIDVNVLKVEGELHAQVCELFGPSLPGF